MKYKKAINKDNLYKALLGRNAQGFAEQITDLLRKTISFYDSTELFYHGLISGLLSGNVYYKVESNRETGDGCSDLILYQQDVAQNAVILEFKVCGKNETADEAAKRVLKQINDHDYATNAGNDTKLAGKGIGPYNLIKTTFSDTSGYYGFNIHTAAHEYIHSEYRIITVKVMYLRRVTHRLEYGIRCVFREEDLGLWQ